MVRAEVGAFNAVTHLYAFRNNPTAITIPTAPTAKMKVKKSVVSSAGLFNHEFCNIN